MLICKDEKSYECSDIKSNTLGETRCLQFTLLEQIPFDEVADLFADDTFYFCDEITNGRLLNAENTKLIGLSITRNADLTHKIKIKLKRSC